MPTTKKLLRALVDPVELARCRPRKTTKPRAQANRRRLKGRWPTRHRTYLLSSCGAYRSEENFLPAGGTEGSGAVTGSRPGSGGRRNRAVCHDRARPREEAERRRRPPAAVGGRLANPFRLRGGRSDSYPPYPQPARSLPVNRSTMIMNTAPLPDSAQRGFSFRTGWPEICTAGCGRIRWAECVEESPYRKDRSSPLRQT